LKLPAASDKESSVKGIIFFKFALTPPQLTGNAFAKHFHYNYNYAKPYFFLERFLFAALPLYLK